MSRKLLHIFPDDVYISSVYEYVSGVIETRDTYTLLNPTNPEGEDTVVARSGDETYASAQIRGLIDLPTTQTFTMPHEDGEQREYLRTLASYYESEALF